MRPYLIPAPRELEYTGGKTLLRDDCPVTVTDAPALPGEAYTLKIERGSVCITASSEPGRFYAKKTLEQIKTTCQGVCDDLVIRDAPVMSHRGFLIDCCRHFYGVEELKRLIDAAASFKLNRFHWHLTDDQGWRIEIKQYPLLTEVGSFRNNSRFGGVNEGKPHDGFFTQEQIREIVDYCAERQIEVIPEIEMPGHFTAAIASYPFLGCTGERMEPEQKEGIFPNVLCVGNEKAVAFVKDVLDEVCGLFPGRFVHIGGDEAPRIRWQCCEKCAAKMRELALDDYDALQGSFIKEIASYLRKMGKTAITWNESLKGDRLYPEDVIVQRWMDRKGLCRGFAEKGGKVIESDFYHYYFDYPYGMTPLKKAFAYDPFAGCGAGAVMGVECCLWTEFVRSFDDLCEKLFPRLLATAERGWSGYPTGRYVDFKTASAGMLPLIGEYGIEPLPPDRWDPALPARAKEVVVFFKGSLDPGLIRQAFNSRK
ncbi:MAG: beta-N-acetylhexosaminidase [Clostridia bacterium]|nr:beta-N-acetylhexosaminidase [Clostridia bacterium]